jgi:Mn-dependent DtxR family transcriptional regulator
MPSILAKPVLTLRKMELNKQEMTLEDKLLLNIHDDPALSLQQRAEAIGASHKMKVSRMLEKLRQQKLIRNLRTNIELTKDGERAVEIIIDGGKFAPSETL